MILFRLLFLPQQFRTSFAFADGVEPQRVTVNLAVVGIFTRSDLASLNSIFASIDMQAVQITSALCDTAHYNMQYKHLEPRFVHSRRQSFQR